MSLSRESQLEELLRLVAEDRPRYYKSFMATLLHSRIYIIRSPFIKGDLSNLIDHHGRLRVNIFRTSDNINLVPFFSSQQHLKTYDPKAKALGVSVPRFLADTRSRGLVLNPGYRYELRFNSYDTERLRYFDYKGYLKKMEEEEQHRLRDDGREGANVIDFCSARSTKNLSRE